MSSQDDLASLAFPEAFLEGNVISITERSETRRCCAFEVCNEGNVAFNLKLNLEFIACVEDVLAFGTMNLLFHDTDGIHLKTLRAVDFIVRFGECGLNRLNLFLIERLGWTFQKNVNYLTIDAMNTQCLQAAHRIVIYESIDGFSMR